MQQWCTRLCFAVLCAGLDKALPCSWIWKMFGLEGKQQENSYLDFCLFVFLEADNKSALVWLENHVAQENGACWVGSVLGLS